MFKWIKENKVLTVIMVAGVSALGYLAYKQLDEELPEELQQLINDVVKRIREGEVKSPEQRIDRLEKLLLEMQDSKGEIQEEKIEIPASK